MDIEGTTTSKDYVFQTLFPFAKTHYKNYINEHLTNPHIQEILKGVASTVLTEENKIISFEEKCDYLLHWMEADRKQIDLKKLQGIIWQAGYEKGLLKSHLYEDVPRMLKQWQQKNIKLGIYSSGSVLAQKLIFQYSTYGDLTPFLSNYFDTVVGHKRDPNSYKQIEKELNIPAPNILFLSDTPEETQAASLANFKVGLIDREKISHDAPGITTYKSFSTLDLDSI